MKRRVWVYGGLRVLALIAAFGLAVVACSEEDSVRERSEETTAESTFEYTSQSSMSEHQAYQPTTRFVIPFAEGTPLDRIARVAAGMAEERLGTYMFVQQRPREAGAVAWRDVADQDPSPNQLVYITEGILTSNENPDVSVDDFEMVSRTDVGAAVLVIRGDSEAESFPLDIDNFSEFVARAKEDPGMIEIADAGDGTVYRAGVLELEREARVDLAPKKLKKSPLETLYNGDVEAALVPAEGEALTDIWAGELTALAVFGDRRIPEMPDVPTTTELGYDVNVPVFGGIAVPAGTEGRFVDELGREFVEVSSSRTFERALAGTGREPMPMGPQEFTDYVEREQRNMSGSGQ